jgi:hypothetical protein
VRPWPLLSLSLSFLAVMKGVTCSISLIMGRTHYVLPHCRPKSSGVNHGLSPLKLSQTKPFLLLSCLCQVFVSDGYCYDCCSGVTTLTYSFHHVGPFTILGYNNEALTKCCYLDIGLLSLQNNEPVHFCSLSITNL